MFIGMGFGSLYNLVFTIQSKIWNISIISENALGKREVLPIAIIF